MGHLIFVILHVIAIAFGFWALIITIPGHLIYSAIGRRSAAEGPVVDPDAPTPSTHVRCPDCRELVRMDAVKCMHCGTALVRQTLIAAAPKIHHNRMLWWFVAIGLGLLLGWSAVRDKLH